VVPQASIVEAVMCCAGAAGRTQAPRGGSDIRGCGSGCGRSFFHGRGL